MSNNTIINKLVNICETMTGARGEVGTIIRKSTKSAPSGGTWKLTGIHGYKYIDDVLNPQHMFFIGKNVIVNVEIKETGEGGTANYAHLLGGYENYQIQDILGSASVVPDDEKKTHKFATFEGIITSSNAVIGIQNATDTSNMHSLTALISITDLEQIPESTTEGLTFEYERIA